MKTLYLLPNLLHEASSWSYVPPAFDALIAESQREGYRFLKRFSLPKLPLYLLNEHTQKPETLIEIPQDKVGLITDSGLPCLADPGAQLVADARKKGIIVETFPGPCSLIMALQLSGFSGQKFLFHGYFPREGLPPLQKNMAHLFIETPYRTEKLFHYLVQSLQPHDNLCVALELMGPHQWVETHTIQEWKKKSIPSGKNRAVFIVERG